MEPTYRRMKPEITIKIQHYPGYGHSPEWEIFAIWENTLLDSKLVGSEFEAGRVEGQFRSKWEKSWSKQAWEKATRNKKAASRLCDHCGGYTLDGCISCVEKIFCYKCESFIEQYKKEYSDKVAASRLASDQQQAKFKEERRKKVDAKLYGAFHWRDNWFFKRQPDGSVAVMRKQMFYKEDNDYYLSPELSIPSNEWASIVCSVSEDGETSERWDAAQDFHGRVKS
jgi:hypothetical protein